jgi:hypothetical protein
MYLHREAVFRQASSVFDERAYGFATLVDLLRAAQKDGIVRVDRDRQGVVPCFQARRRRRRLRSASGAARRAKVPMVMVSPAITDGDDLSVGPGNVEQPVFHEPNRRRRAPRRRAAPASPGDRARRSGELTQ